ncbi:hypothetical protein [Shinella sp. JR1-6]|uniref:hypothetical protein n=1 Tax=Shinella sp. JR1-6 TaxID=2527671 RepID=UPI00102D39A7|nr:hypothetical protein [Shinella sp. JR1-6]TAA55276.1 hypothetical protein EXZ48_24910 [Shinella sp. JR1-6]
MEHDASSDRGTVLPAGSSALVVEAGGVMSLLLADYPDDAEIPLLVQVLAAVAIHSTDKDWIAEVLAIFDEKQAWS